MTASFEALLSLLSSNKVDVIVIGGVAGAVHGSAFVTQDLDVCYRRSPENVQRLCAALDAIHPVLRGAPAGLPFRFDPPTVLNGLNFTLESDLGPIDLLGEVQPFGDYERVLERAESVKLFDREVFVLSLPALIETKRAAGRPKDKLVLPELEALLELTSGKK